MQQQSEHMKFDCTQPIACGIPINATAQKSKKHSISDTSMCNQEKVNNIRFILRNLTNGTVIFCSHLLLYRVVLPTLQHSRHAHMYRLVFPLLPLLCELQHSTVRSSKMVQANWLNLLV